MLARGRGYIAGVASIAGYRAVPAAGAYGASKAAVIHMLDSIRFELEPRGIKVSVVNPGFVKTPLTDRNRFPMPFLMPLEAAVKARESRPESLHLDAEVPAHPALPDLPVDHAPCDQGAAAREGGGDTAIGSAAARVNPRR